MRIIDWSSDVCSSDLEAPMTQRALPVWRSILFVPVNVEKFVAKAAGVGADALKLDLEDSIGPSDKDSARRMAPDVARRLNEAGDEVLVRVNRPWRLLLRDLEAMVPPHVSQIVLPKADSTALDRASTEERRGGGGGRDGENWGG